MIYFIGAGPGDPELITVKGKRLIDEADIIIYAGSLVNPQVLSGAKPEAEIYNSATMHLQEVLDVMKRGVKAGKKVVRVHTGDPSIYGAHREQMVELDKLGIPYEIVPGVSSFLAAAASLKREYTLPGVTLWRGLSANTWARMLPKTSKRLSASFSTSLISLTGCFMRLAISSSMSRT